MKILKNFILLSALIVSTNSFASSFPAKPSLGSFIIDEAGMINENDKQEINNISKKLLTEKQIPIFVITINSLANYGADNDGIEKYTTDLFNKWAIGNKDLNYGMLLLISKTDRKARIEFGASFDHRYDREASSIMNDFIIPDFKQGDFSNGILAGVKALDTIARGLTLPKSSTSNGTTASSQQPMSSSSSIILLVLMAAAVIGIAYSLFKSGKTGWGWAFLAFVGVILFMLLKSGSNGGSGGGFGGGSGGGGGASGSW